MQFILMLHILGAVGMGFYLLLPFLCVPLMRMDRNIRAGYLYGLRLANKSAMYLLIVLLLTGGYLYFKGDYAIGWTIGFAVPFLAMGPLTGNIGKRLDKALELLRSAQEANGEIARIRVLSALAFLAMIAVLILMVYPA